MQAVVIRQYGGPEVLSVEEMPEPRPGPSEVLVRVEASSINPIDWKIRQGQLKWLQGWKFPRILGFDLCGQVVQAGSEAKRFTPGQTVYARSDRSTGEAHAELVVTGQDSLALAPETMSHQEAATLPLAGLTALQALRDLGRLQRGQRVLVLGASGGVGMFAVQIARALGSEVFGVCGPDNLDFVQELGAAGVLDYRSQTLSQAPGPFDLVLDAVGLYGFARARPLLTRRGRYVSTLPTVSLLLRLALGNLVSPQKAHFIWVKPLGRDLELLTDWVNSGQLRTHLDSQFSLGQIREAHRRSESGRVRGKISITIG